MTDITPATRSLRRASLAAGIALAIMAVLGVFGGLVAVDALLTPGDAEQTAADILADEQLFRLGVASLLAVAVLDVVVAGALYSLFETVNRTVAMTAAWFRVAYAAAFTAAIGQLAIGLTRLPDPEPTLAAVESFTSMWNLALAVFSAHLLLVGWLAYRSGFMPRFLGVLLGIAGLGYLVDGMGTILVRDYTFEAAMFTFAGEIVLIVWLLVKGIRISVEDSPTARLSTASLSRRAPTGSQNRPGPGPDTEGVRPSPSRSGGSASN